MKLIAPKDMVIVKTNVEVDSLSSDISNVREGIVIASDEKTNIPSGYNVFFGSNYAQIPPCVNNYICISMPLNNIYVAWTGTEEAADNVIELRREA